MEQLNDYKKQILEFDKTVDYFIEKLKNGNSLSKSILENINLKDGLFFTFIKNNFNLSCLYKFQQGGLISQIKSTQKLSSGYFIPLTSTFDKLYEFTFEYLILDENNYAIFEDVVWERKSKNIMIPEVKLCFDNNDVYYVLNKQVSEINVARTLNNADGIWHFLGVYSNGIIDNIPKELGKKDFFEICERIKYLIIGAYDGESFIFWERSS